MRYLKLFEEYHPYGETSYSKPSKSQKDFINYLKSYTFTYVVSEPREIYVEYNDFEARVVREDSIIIMSVMRDDNIVKEYVSKETDKQKFDRLVQLIGDYNSERGTSLAVGSNPFEVIGFED